VSTDKIKEKKRKKRGFSRLSEVGGKSEGNSGSQVGAEAEEKEWGLSVEYWEEA